MKTILIAISGGLIGGLAVFAWFAWYFRDVFK